MLPPILSDGPSPKRLMTAKSSKPGIGCSLARDAKGAPIAGTTVTLPIGHSGAALGHT